eukprot:4502714-Pyramimonas_sp.AAC.1
MQGMAVSARALCEAIAAMHGADKVRAALARANKACYQIARRLVCKQADGPERSYAVPWCTRFSATAVPSRCPHGWAAYG